MRVRPAIVVGVALPQTVSVLALILLASRRLWTIPASSRPANMSPQTMKCWRRQFVWFNPGKTGQIQIKRDVRPSRPAKLGHANGWVYLSLHQDPALLGLRLRFSDSDRSSSPGVWSLNFEKNEKKCAKDANLLADKKKKMSKRRQKRLTRSPFFETIDSSAGGTKKPKS